MNKSDIQDWLIKHLADLLDLAPEDIQIQEPFTHYGLSSRDAVTLSGELEELLGRRLSPTLAYEYPSIALLAGYLAEPAENKSLGFHTESLPSADNGPIAIIGIGCRFPGAKDPEAYWELLRTGTDAITEVPADRWNKDEFYHSDPSVPGKAVSYWGGFLEGIDQFDPFFFGISPAEAKYLDPQQRLLMELSYEALDDAGKTKEQIAGSDTGVFIGISISEYSQLQFDDPTLITSHSGTGSALSIAANRISYFYDFHGPSMAIDTACSSSLAAVHLACKSLRSGECKMALAGGVNMILSPAHSIAFTKAGVLAPDGRCKSFDAAANGYVRGEGGGIIVLKPLSSALADGDPIYAVIEGSAINQDGRTNGLMAPDPEAQEVMLRAAYHNAGIAPETVQYVETHGTGTLLGDSMEAKALGAVLGANRSQEPFAIGSVKTNIGHLEAAAGIAGLIKVALSIKNKALPPSIHFQTPNPHIPFKELHIRVQNKLAPWPSVTGIATAGVSSFGFGGTNVHVVLREADPVPKVENAFHQMNEKEAFLLPLSANSYESLQSLAGSIQHILSADAQIDLHNFCYAAGVRRGQYYYRLAVTGHSPMELSAGLSAFLKSEHHHSLITGSGVTERPRKLVFVFPGQGGQWQCMGCDLLQREPVFHNAIERMGKAMKAYCDWSLPEVLKAAGPSSRLDEIDIVQPAIFAIQVALAELWKSWGIIPDAVVGHSMGEVAAAHVAGILSLEDAVRIICLRSQLLKQVRGIGGMLVTELSPDQASAWLKGYEKDISIAVMNSPTSTVLSGDKKAIQNVMDAMQEQNLFCRLVNVDVASHSPQMEPIRAELLQALDGLQPKAENIPIYSTVTGARENGTHFNAQYWMDNLRQPVHFSGAVEKLLDSGHTTFMEIGPHPVLLGSIQQSLLPRHKEVRLLPSLRREEPGREIMLGSLGVLYTEGFPISWKNIYPNAGKYVRLPLAPWQRQRYWMDKTTTKDARRFQNRKDQHGHPLLGEKINPANTPSTFVWQREIDNASIPFLSDHKIEQSIIFPAAGYMEIALQVMAEMGFNQTHDINDFIFKEKMVLDDGKARIIQAVLTPAKEKSYQLSIYSKSVTDENWVLHATSSLIPQENEENLIPIQWSSVEEIRKQAAATFSAATFYQILQERGINYGHAFRGVELAWQKGNESLGRIVLPDLLQHEIGEYQMHPAMLDACLQVLAAAKGTSGEHDLYLPTGCRRIRFFSKPGRVVWSYVKLHPESPEGAGLIHADIYLWDESHQLIAELTGFQLKHLGKRIPAKVPPKDTWLYRLQWQAKEAPAAPSVSTSENRHWLIFADDIGVGQRLAEELQTMGDNCHIVPYHHTLDGAETTDDASLLAIMEQHINATSSPWYGVIHLWSLSIPPASPDDENAMDKMLLAGSNSVLLLVQALAKRLAGLPHLWLVTRGAQPVNEGDPIAVEQSAIWGLGKVISFEIPDLNCTRIDLDPAEPPAEAVPLLIRQISLNDREDQIAFRGGSRFVLRLLPFSYAPASLPISFKTNGTYLVTGGLGGLGLATANWMVEQGASHLVLMGRSNPSADALRMVQEMKHAGAEVVVALADVSDVEQVEQVCKKMEEDLPPLRGVIHAAGVLDDGALLNLDMARMKKVMAPKVQGTWNLHKATLHAPLDFFVLFSSVVSVLGSPGQGNYASASAYLDAMAWYRRQSGLPAISINWGPWAEVGLAAEATDRLREQNASTQHLIKVIKVNDGLEILGQLLTDPTPQITVLPFDLANLLDLYPTAAGMPFFSEVGGSSSHVARLYARPNLRQMYVAPRNPIESRLADLWRQTLHIDRVGIHDSFFELGGDSVLAAQILALAQKAFGIRIDPKDAFQAFTIERLAVLLEEALINKIEAMSEEEAQALLSKHN